MKKVFLICSSAIVFTILLAFTMQPKKATPKYFAGDIIFISNPAGYGKEFQKVSKSPYTRIGLILPDKALKGSLVVYYVSDKVKKSSIAEFLALSPDGKYEHMRMRDSTALRFTGIPNMIEQANKLMNLPYDKVFSWSDMEMYPSEFVWKVYKRAIEIKLGEFNPLGNNDITSPVLQKALKEKYGDNIPIEAPFISPEAMHNCEWLVKINK